MSTSSKRVTGRMSAEASRGFEVMGVVNVTPDSFSDGGLYLDRGAAVRHGLELDREGATILDVGGESTRPGAEPVEADEELRRVVPVIEGLISAGASAAISIDTSKAEVARLAMAAGATMINDVTGLRAAPEIADIAAETDARLCLMHMLGTPRTMQDDPHYDDVVSDVKRFLAERMAVAVGRGVPESNIVLDPGIGFGKTVEHNLELIRRLPELLELGRPVLIGTSLKSFLERSRAVSFRRSASRPPSRRSCWPMNVARRSFGSTTSRPRSTRSPWHRACCGLRSQVSKFAARPSEATIHMNPDPHDHDEDDDELDDLEDLEPDEDGDDDDDDDEGHPEPEVTIEVSGLTLYTHMGVSAAEREIGQRLLVDIRLDIGECDATVTDRVEDTVDYGKVCELVSLISQQREYRTLERFCAAVADQLIERYEAHSVWVKAAKPEPPIPLPVGEVSVEVWREA